MGKNRRSGGNGSNNIPRETPEQFQERYDNALKSLENWKTEGGRRKISSAKIKRLLDAVLDENTEFIGIDGNKICFEERNGPLLNIGLSSFNDMCKTGSVISVEDMMSVYRSVPSFWRSFATEVNFGDTGRNFHGGFYSPSRNSVNLNGKLFKKDAGLKSMSIESTLEHEFTHCVDHHILSNGASNKSGVFQSIMQRNKASAYSEGFSKGSDKFYKESLAEAVMVTRMAQKHGAGNAYIEDPSKSRGHDMGYTSWASKNEKLADFAVKFVNCKNTNDLKELMGV